MLLYKVNLTCEQKARTTTFFSDVICHNETTQWTVEHTETLTLQRYCLGKVCMKILISLLDSIMFPW